MNDCNQHAHFQQSCVSVMDYIGLELGRRGNTLNILCVAAQWLGNKEQELYGNIGNKKKFHKQSQSTCKISRHVGDKTLITLGLRWDREGTP